MGVEPMVGTCPWCGRHRIVLYFTIWTSDGELHTEWLCDKCRHVWHDMIWNKLMKPDKK